MASSRSHISQKHSAKATPRLNANPSQVTLKSYDPQGGPELPEVRKLLDKAEKDPELSGYVRPGGDLQRTLIYHDGRLVGFMTPRKVDGGWRAGAMYVDADERSKYRGIGRAALSSFFSDKEASPVLIGESNRYSRKAFEGAGFKDTGVTYTGDDGWRATWFDRRNPKKTSGVRGMGSSRSHILEKLANRAAEKASNKRTSQRSSSRPGTPAEAAGKTFGFTKGKVDTQKAVEKARAAAAASQKAGETRSKSRAWARSLTDAQRTELNTLFKDRSKGGRKAFSAAVARINSERRSPAKAKKPEKQVPKAPATSGPVMRPTAADMAVQSYYGPQSKMRPSGKQMASQYYGQQSKMRTPAAKPKSSEGFPYLSYFKKYLGF